MTAQLAGAPSSARATRPWRHAAAVLTLVTAASLLSACAGDPGQTSETSPDTSPGAGPGATAAAQAPGPELTGELTVYAAASLSAAFDDLATRFEELHPALDVAPVVYDGSATLATQIVEGAPADVFAAADETTMATVAGAGLLTGPAQLFAANTLVIALPPGNPGEVTGLDDLARSDVSVVLCVAAAPCGSAAHQLLDATGLSVTPVSEEQNVSAVLTKVAADEADAGLVYATDVASAPAVTSVVPVGAEDVVNHYPVAALTDAGNPTAAAAFVAFVLSPAGQDVLAGYGFGAP